MIVNVFFSPSKYDNAYKKTAKSLIAKLFVAILTSIHLTKIQVKFHFLQNPLPAQYFLLRLHHKVLKGLSLHELHWMKTWV